VFPAQRKSYHCFKPLAGSHCNVYNAEVKAISILEAQGQLGQLIAEACRGETIVLTDGDRRVTLEPGVAPDLEEDSPELEAELLKAVNGPHSPYSSEEMRAACERIVRNRRG
jgi:hypothetical protein